MFIPQTAHCTNPLFVQPFLKKIPVSGRRRRPIVRASLRPPLKPSVRISRTGLSQRYDVVNAAHELVRHGQHIRLLRCFSCMFPLILAYGFFTKGTFRASSFTHTPVVTSQPPLPAAFPSPHRCLLEVTPLSRRFRYYSAVRLLTRLHFPFRSSLIGSLILTPLRNPMSSPGVTHCSSASCRPHTPWYNG